MAIVHEVFAQVSDGVVQNIMVCENYPMADYLTKCTYGDEAFAVDVLQYNTGIGDLYHDGFFWRVDEETGEETQIPYTPTQEQQVAALTLENEETTLLLSDMIGGSL